MHKAQNMTRVVSETDSRNLIVRKADDLRAGPMISKNLINLPFTLWNFLQINRDTAGFPLFK